MKKIYYRNRNGHKPKSEKPLDASEQNSETISDEEENESVHEETI